jgi:hypothetical protein
MAGVKVAARYFDPVAHYHRPDIFSSTSTPAPALQSSSESRHPTCQNSVDV